MSFASSQFLVFFPIVVFFYYLMPNRFRWAFLLAASCIFYMAFIPKYILILCFTIGVDYAAALGIARSTGARKKALLWLSIISTCGVLVVFKYFNFFVGSLESVAEFFDLRYPLHALAIILPIGLSFHTFQSLSYVIEVYRGRQQPERHPGIYALYVMFFPQMVAGPIERPQHLLHQFHEEKRLDPGAIASGLRLMAWGFFKKLVISDRISGLVDTAYQDPQQCSGPQLILATLFFSVQIYCDFSGYSDIARGAARVLGYDIMANFRQPYFAASTADFWTRWHISLSTWFRDYFYIPLGGSRKGSLRGALNLMAAFLVSGLWHGANWTFMLWGGLNGLFVLVGRVRSSLRGGMQPLPGPLQRAAAGMITFCLVSFAWIFFRASSLADAALIVYRSLTVWSLEAIAETAASIKTLSLFGIPYFDPLIYLSLIMLLVVDLWHEHPTGRLACCFQNPKLRWAGYFSLIAAILLMGNFQSSSPFIYFQF